MPKFGPFYIVEINDDLIDSMGLRLRVWKECWQLTEGQDVQMRNQLARMFFLFEFPLFRAELIKEYIKIKKKKEEIDESRESAEDAGFKLLVEKDPDQEGLSKNKESVDDFISITRLNDGKKMKSRDFWRIHPPRALSISGQFFSRFSIEPGSTFRETGTKIFFKMFDSYFASKIPVGDVFEVQGAGPTIDYQFLQEMGFKLFLVHEQQVKPSIIGKRIAECFNAPRAEVGDRHRKGPRPRVIPYIKTKDFSFIELDFLLWHASCDGFSKLDLEGVSERNILEMIKEAKEFDSLAVDGKYKAKKKVRRVLSSNEITTASGSSLEDKLANILTLLILDAELTKAWQSIRQRKGINRYGFKSNLARYLEKESEETGR